MRFASWLMPQLDYILQFHSSNYLVVEEKSCLKLDLNQPLMKRFSSHSMISIRSFL